MIKVNDIVYQKKRGFSGVAMRVLEITQKNTPNGLVTQALCCGAKGWSVHGLISVKHGVRVDRFAISNLTTIPNSMVG